MPRTKKPGKKKETSEQRRKRQFTQKWKDELIFTIYDLAKHGKKDSAIARIVGVEVTTFNKWKAKRELVQMALDYGRSLKGPDGATNAVEQFQTYVYNQLSPSLQKTWDEINGFENEQVDIRKVEAILKDRGDNVRKHLFIHAFIVSDFNKSEACRRVNVSLSVLERWKKDPKFAELLAEINMHKKNFFESHLIQLVKKGDSTATIFANKTFNRDLGYNDKQEIHHTGSVEHNHNMIRFQDLDLSIACKKEILEAIRKKKALEAPVPDNGIHQLGAIDV